MTALVPNRANGFFWRDGKFQNAGIYFALRPSGAFLSTVLDLAKWDAALYTDKILKQAIRDQMWTGVKLSSGNTHPYGFGWDLDTVNGHKIVRHGGSLPGFRAMLARFPDDKITVVVLTNGDNANPAGIALNVAAQFIPGLIPERTARKIDPRLLDAYVGEYKPNETIVVTVTREGDKLVMQQGSGQKRELTAETESNFFTVEDRRLTISFVKDDKGQVAYLVVQNEGREQGRAKKVK
jgi:CubicO group peptidase (beta-lactamase class C family)